MARILPFGNQAFAPPGLVAPATPLLNHLGLLQQLRDLPRLGLRELPRGNDLDQIAFLVFVVLVVRVVLRRLRHDLAVERMLDAPSTSTVTVLFILSPTTRP